MPPLAGGRVSATGWPTANTCGGMTVGVAVAAKLGGMSVSTLNGNTSAARSAAVVWLSASLAVKVTRAVKAAVGVPLKVRALGLKVSVDGRAGVALRV